MLQSIRDKTSGWIAYLIIGLISIPFALWGINSYLGGGEQQPAAIVNGDDIPPRQLDSAYARYRERLSSMFGGNLPAAFDNEIMLKEQVLTQLIEERVLLGYVQDQGFRIGDKKLFEKIQAMPVFEQDGTFDKELYRDQLASQGYHPALFEQEIRRSSEMQQLDQGIKNTAFTVPSRIDLFNSFNNQSRKIRTVTVSSQWESMTVSDEDIEKHYDAQSAQYMEPEKLKVDYIEISLENIKQSIEVSEDLIFQRYEQLKEQLTTPEMRQASHILLTVDAEGGEEERARVEQTILQLKKRIVQGEDFATLAREFSQDPGSAEQGGDLGEVERGMMVKPFETVLFSLTKGEISDPVNTQFGWHLIKLDELSGGDVKSLEQASEEIAEEIKTEMAESQIYDLAEDLANIGYEQPDSILPASEQLGLKLQTTDWFTRANGEGPASEDKFRQAAFSDDVLKLNRNSETLELAENRIVIMHSNSHKPAEKKALKNVRDSIVETLKKKMGEEETLSTGKQWLAELNDGATLDSVAEKSALSVEDAGFIKRSGSSVNSDVVNVAFTMTKPANNSSVYEGVTEVDGDYTLIELTEVRIETQQLEDEKAEDVEKQMTSSMSNYEYQAFIKSLTEQADIIRTPVSELQ